jgi:hypothetical protein
MTLNQLLMKLEFLYTYTLSLFGATIQDPFLLFYILENYC